MPTLGQVEVVAHRAGNRVETTREALGKVDMIELDVHVLRGRVELRHEKVLHPTQRLWERWYLLPRGAAGEPIEHVLAEVEPDTPLMIDLKCFTRRSARRVRAALPEDRPVIVSTRNWRVLAEFADRPDTRLLRSCGSRWQLWWALNRSTFGPERGVCVHESRLEPGVIEAMQQRTELIFSWGATSKERCIELRDAGLTGIILDDHSIAP
jgi:hypothetical protein